MQPHKVHVTIISMCMCIYIYRKKIQKFKQLMDILKEHVLRLALFISFEFKRYNLARIRKSTLTETFYNRIKILIWRQHLFSHFQCSYIYR